MGSLSQACVRLRGRGQGSGVRGQGPGIGDQGVASLLSIVHESLIELEFLNQGAVIEVLKQTFDRLYA